MEQYTQRQNSYLISLLLQGRLPPNRQTVMPHSIPHSCFGAKSTWMDHGHAPQQVSWGSGQVMGLLQILSVSTGHMYCVWGGLGDKRWGGTVKVREGTFRSLGLVPFQVGHTGDLSESWSALMFIIICYASCPSLQLIFQFLISWQAWFRACSGWGTGNSEGKRRVSRELLPLCVNCNYLLFGLCQALYIP